MLWPCVKMLSFRWSGVLSHFNSLCFILPLKMRSLPRARLLATFVHRKQARSWGLRHHFGQSRRKAQEMLWADFSDLLLGNMDRDWNCKTKVRTLFSNRKEMQETRSKVSR